MMNCPGVKGVLTILQDLLQKQFETATNVERKRAGAPKMTTTSENKHLIVESKIHRMKTAPQVTAKLYLS